MGGFAVQTTGMWSPVTLTSRMTIEIDGQPVFVPERNELIRLLRRFGRAKALTRATLLERVADRLAAPSLRKGKVNAL